MEVMNINDVAKGLILISPFLDAFTKPTHKSTTTTASFTIGFLDVCALGGGGGDTYAQETLV